MTRRGLKREDGGPGAMKSKLPWIAGLGILLVALLLFAAVMRGNRAPRARDISVETREDTPTVIFLRASDPDGDPLAWVLDAPPSHGSLDGALPELSYDPAPDYHGLDGFSFHVNDGVQDSNVAAVRITVAAVNDPPVVEDISATTPEETPVAIALKANDPDGDDLTYEIVSPPRHGALSAGGGQYVYAPDSDWAGRDSFTYRAHDGRTHSNEATVSVRTTLRGTVWAFGDNERGQLGDGTRESRSSPYRVEWLARAKAVSAGWYHSLALLEDGSVWAWGRNSHVAVGEERARSTRTPVEMQQLPPAVAVAAGSYHSLALAADGTVWEWQNSAQGLICHGESAAAAPSGCGPWRVKSLHGVTAIAAGFSHSLALRKDGTVWAWGRNHSGQLGDGTRGRERRHVPIQVSNLTKVAAIASGYHHSLALKADGTVWTWGSNSQGQLGDGTKEHRSTPGRVQGLTDAVAIAGGSCHSLAVKADGTVWSWGWNKYGQLGDGTTEDRHAPDQVRGLTEVAAVAAGDLHSFAVKKDGTAWAWGSNSHGQLGDGTRRNERLLPVRVSRAVGVSSIAGGHWHSVAVEGLGSGNHAPEARDMSTPTAEGTSVPITLQASDPDGDDLTCEIVRGPSHGELSGEGPERTYTPEPGYVGVDTFTYRARDGEAAGNAAAVTVRILGVEKKGRLWAWGYNVSGQLGDGTTENRHAPVPVRGLVGVVAVSGGNDHSLALRHDGTVWAWGENRFGRVGDGTKEDRRVPVLVSGLPGVRAIGAGGLQSLAVGADGTAWSWGWNLRGALGDGTTDDRDAPVQVKDLTGVVAVSAGSHCLALMRDGTIRGWGSNYVGQVGDGSLEHRLVPVQAEGLTGVKAVSVGGVHSHALLADGTVWSWGWNREGQLGDGTGKKWSKTHVQVKSLTDINAIAAGQTFCLALTKDGAVWAWGNNAYGQLGDGTTEHRHTPVQVHGMTQVKAISAGYWHAMALKDDGTVWAWGMGHLGQLGDGAAEDRHEPVQVWGLEGVVAVAAAGNHSFALSEGEETSAREDEF